MREGGAACVVVACEHDAAPECDEAAASMWKTAALALPGARGDASLAELIDLDYGAVAARLVRDLLEARAVDPLARGAFVARVSVGGPGVVRAGGTIARAAAPPPVAAAASSAAFVPVAKARAQGTSAQPGQ